MIYKSETARFEFILDTSEAPCSKVKWKYKGRSDSDYMACSSLYMDTSLNVEFATGALEVITKYKNQSSRGEENELVR